MEPPVHHPLRTWQHNGVRARWAAHKSPRLAQLPPQAVRQPRPHPPSAGMARSVRPPIPVHAHLRTHRGERREICEEPQGGQAGSSRREQVRADPGRHPSAAAIAIAEYRLTAERHEENEHQPTTTTNITNDNGYSKQQRTFQTATNTNNDRRLGAMMTLTDCELIIRKLLRTRTTSVYGYATLR